jgi:pyridoxamine 5'-phosphate oxidase
MDNPFEALQTPPEIRKRIWQELARAVQDRHHEWRTPVLATTQVGGAPNARTGGVPNARMVVLREVDADLARLSIYTDSRSDKVSELANHPDALLVFWSKRLSWQLRVRVSVRVHVAGPLVDAAWERVRQTAAASDYLSPAAPGSTLSVASSSKDGTQPTKPSNPTSQHHLAIIEAQVQEIDWLELARSGHRRARLRADTWDWLTP